MISVIIPTLNDASRLAGCLAPLVPAAMGGMIKELIVVDGGSTDETIDVADDAGARIVRRDGDVETRLAAGAAVAKQPWLLLLEPQVELEPGWASAVEKHLTRSKKPARMSVRKRDAGLMAALSPPKATALLVLKQAGDGGGGFDARGAVRLADARGWV